MATPVPRPRLVSEPDILLECESAVGRRFAGLTGRYYPKAPAVSNLTKG
jgi:hypothetical protein